MSMTGIENYCIRRNAKIGSPEVVCYLCNTTNKPVDVLKKIKNLSNNKWKKIKKNKCKHGTNTGDPVNVGGCKSCGRPTWIICSNKKIAANRVNSNVCKTCPHFSPSIVLAAGDENKNLTPKNEV